MMPALIPIGQEATKKAPTTQLLLDIFFSKLLKNILRYTQVAPAILCSSSSILTLCRHGSNSRQELGLPPSAGKKPDLQSGYINLY